MAEWIPLLQTLVWPTFLFIFVIWRRQDIVAILRVLKERIEKGAAIELPGGWKVGELPQPIDNDKQFDKVINALQSALQTILSPEQIKDVTAKAEFEIRQEAFLTIDATPLLGTTVEPWIVPYTRFSTVSSLLNDIWVTIRQHGYPLPNLSFGSAWVLQVDRRRLTEQDIGIRWARKYTNKEFDERPLDHPDIGIKPGMQLNIVPV